MKTTGTRKARHGVKRSPRFATFGARLRHACTAPTGVHSVLDVLVLADVVHTVRAGAVAVCSMAAAWYVARTVFALAATYFDSAEA